MSCHDDILMGAFHLLLLPFPKVARLLPMGLATFSWGETWGVGEWCWGWGGGGVLLGILGGFFAARFFKILTLFSDLASRIHTRFKTWPLRNYVITS